LAGPVVQVMGRAMAVAALRELGVHGFRMGHAVAVAALGNHAVLVDVTGDAGNLVVFGCAAGQLIVGRIMAGGAQLGAGIIAVGQFHGLVGLVANGAVRFSHGFGVR